MNNFKFKRVFLIVTDSVGIGSMKDADNYFNAGHNDKGSNTLVHISEKMPGGLNIPTLNSLGIGKLDDICGTKKVSNNHSILYKCNEMSIGKDTMTGHWEMMGVYTTKPFVSFTDNGFPKELIDELENKTGHKIIGNYASSGTEILKALGEQQKRDNSLIVYTSADSVLQIAAHEETTGLKELYRVCDIARQICLKPEWKVGRIIARPFIGNNKEDFKRVTAHRHDIALKPPYETSLNILSNNNLEVVSIGKINDIFDGFGITSSIKTSSNEDGMNKTIDLVKNNDFIGLCFVNLVEFDSEYGHRRDPIGYGKCLERFDIQLNEMIQNLHDDDLLIITADHGNDPTWQGTDHTREKVPVIFYSKKITNGKVLKERDSFADIGATILENFKLNKPNYLLGKIVNEVFEE